MIMASSFKTKEALKKHNEMFHEVGSNYHINEKIGSGSYGEIGIGINLPNYEEVAVKVNLVVMASLHTKDTLKKHNKIFHEVGFTYHVNEKIGSGSFCEIRTGINLTNNEEVAVKLEPIATRPKYQRLLLEFEFYQLLGNHEGIPETYILGSFNNNKYNAMVMELLGPSLFDLFKLCNREFSLKTVLQIGIQLIDLLEYIHSKHLIHQDVKPENFLIGQTLTDKESVIHVVDLGLSKKYINSETGKHIPFKEGTGIAGTPRFMSINTHLGKEQSRRDDLESLGYMLVYFLRGDLPWEMKLLEPRTLRRVKILKTQMMKMEMSISSLCRNYCSTETIETIVAYFELVRNLDFEEEPKYCDLRMLFCDLMKSKGLENDGDFDWISKI
jgi:casein kinase 1 gamma